jgi:hypothetical protein
MFWDRFTIRLAILALPMTFGVAGAGVPGAEAGSVPADDEPCKNGVLSPVPISLCKLMEP